jgi:hypothetical protein
MDPANPHDPELRAFAARPREAAPVSWTILLRLVGRRGRTPGGARDRRQGWVPTRMAHHRSARTVSKSGGVAERRCWVTGTAPGGLPATATLRDLVRLGP